MIHLRLLLAAMFVNVAMVTSGCERPFDRTPAGFAEACFGGRATAARNWVCSENRVVVHVQGTEADWPLLARVVSEYGRSRGLEVFDTSKEIPGYIRSLEVGVCSSKGLYLLLDKRIYADKALNRDGDRITTHLRTYDNSFEWRHLAEELVAEFQKKWRSPIEVEWPEPIGEARALPDNVPSCDDKHDTD